MKKKIIKKICKEEKGITLIALVITIIVLLILAGVAISMLTGDNGILKQAVKAKEETEKKSIQENIQLAVLSAMSNTSHELTLESLKAEVKSQLGNDVEVEQDGIGGYVIGKNQDENGHLKDVYGVVDKEGIVGEGKWHFVKLTEVEEDDNGDIIISDGVTQLIVGNKINYNAKSDENNETVEKSYKSEGTINGNNKYYTYKTSGYDGEWEILGAENGKVIIVPMYSIMVSETDDTGSYKQYLTLTGEDGIQNGISELNRISEIYGYGKGAESARSITVEDINKITGYDPNYVGQNVNKTKKEELKLKRANEGNMTEYGNEVSYYWERR